MDIKKVDLKKELKQRRLIIDGGLGSLLQSRIDDIGHYPEALGITHPDVLVDIHKAYVEAGANIVLANTFGANRYKLAGCSYKLNEIIPAAVANARAASPEFVALDIGPLGDLIGPLGKITFDEAYRAFSEVVDLGVKAGADLIIIETMTDIYEARAALLAAKEHSDLPVIVSMTYEVGGRTLTGSDPLTVVTILEGLGADAIGMNCSTGPNEMLPVIKTLLAEATVPVMVEPNAGLPQIIDGKTVYDVDAESFSEIMVEIAKAGALILGGCCGTTPEYIRCVAQKTASLPLQSHSLRERKTRVASATKTITLGEDIIIIGECINPTANKALKEDLRAGNLNVVKQLALKQKDQGAHILDVNLGLPEIDEKKMMTEAVTTLSEIVDCPLQIDSTNPEVLEAALREYNGIAIINSVNGEKTTMEAILPIAKKYGACVLGLTMDEKGLPETRKQRLEIAGKIIDNAASYGIPREKMLIDCLVLTVSAQQKAVFETLTAIQDVADTYGVPTVLGVSNISFGLPHRGLINRSFLTMAMAFGLNTPIINPGNREMMDAIAAFRALRGYDEGCTDYVAAYSSAAESENNGVIDRSQPQKKDLKTMVIEGLADEAREATRRLLQAEAPLDIVNNYLIPGLDVVGDRFETGEAFLPNLIFAAETVHGAFDIIKEAMKGEEVLVKGTILLATVEGDVHDIGKNILKVILENYGYAIIDLGKDVSADAIVQAVLEKNIALVGLSALMTTTVRNIEKTIVQLKAQCPETKIMVGGAVLNENYAEIIGADFYGKDAKAGVEIARSVFS